MSCVGFLTPSQRAALAASSSDGPPLSRFASPEVSAGKVARLRALARSNSAAIRESAALAYAAPADLLSTLAVDLEPGVRACVARNPRTPPAVLGRLAEDPDQRVRGWVAGNPETDPDTLSRLSGDQDPQVRAVAAWARRWEQPQARERASR